MPQVQVISIHRLLMRSQQDNMKKLYLILLLLFTAIIVSGCAEQIIAIPRAGVNLIGNTTSAIWHLLTGWI